VEHDFEKALNMKIIICIFKQLSSLKINLHKNKIFYFGQAKEVEDDDKLLSDVKHDL
jgi:hypothetical protein